MFCFVYFSVFIFGLHFCVGLAVGRLFAKNKILVITADFRLLAICRNSQREAKYLETHQDVRQEAAPGGHVHALLTGHLL